MTQKEKKKMRQCYVCELCDRSFDHKDAHDRHVTAKHTTKETRLYCTLCDFWAVSKDILDIHMKIAMGHKKNQVCKYFRRGTCKNGTFCKYQHPVSNVSRNQSTRYQNNMRYQNTRNQNNLGYQCKYYDNCF